MVRRTKQEAQETRHRILDAAENVFHERGVAHASLEDIAAAAEVTRGAIYWHFKDKAELFDAMMQRVVLPAEEMIEHAETAADGNKLTQLRNATVDVLMRTATDARMQRIFEIAYHKCEYVGDARGVRDRHIASQAECMRTIEEGFRACAASGDLQPGVDPRVAAMGAMSLVSGVIANWVLDKKSFPLKKHAEALVDIFFRGLASAPKVARQAQSGSESRIQEPAHVRTAAARPRPAPRR